MNSSAQSRLAVLIDADNAQPAIVDGLLAEVGKYGTASVKRIYGDWTGPQLQGWKKVLLSHSIQPIQQFRYTTQQAIQEGTEPVGGTRVVAQLPVVDHDQCG